MLLRNRDDFLLLIVKQGTKFGILRRMKKVGDFLYEKRQSPLLLLEKFLWGQRPACSWHIIRKMVRLRGSVNSVIVVSLFTMLMQRLFLLQILFCVLQQMENFQKLMRSMDESFGHVMLEV